MAVNPPTKKLNQIQQGIPTINDYIVGFEGVSLSERRWQFVDIFSLFNTQLTPILSSVNNNIASISGDIDDIENSQLLYLSAAIDTNYTILTGLSVVEIRHVSEIAYLSASIDLLSAAVENENYGTQIYAVSTSLDYLSTGITTNFNVMTSLCADLRLLRDNRFAEFQFLSTDHSVTSADLGRYMIFQNNYKTLILPPSGSGIPERSRIYTVLATQTGGFLTISAYGGARLNSRGSITITRYDIPITVLYLSGNDWYAFGNLLTEGIYQLDTLSVEVGMRSTQYDFELQNLAVEVGIAENPYGIQFDAFGVEAVGGDPIAGIELDSLSVEIIVEP